MKLCYDEKKEKGYILRRMWRDIFADPASYEEFYYQWMYPKNQVLTAVQEEEIVGMIHLNPYRVQVQKAAWDLHYIVGVATLEKCRRQGVMRKMLLRCMEDLARKGEPFTYLMPADQAYYEPFDFVFVQKFDTATCVGEGKKSQLKVLKKEDFPRAEMFLREFFKQNFCVYTQIDALYLMQLQAECHSERGEILVLEEKGEICGFCCYGQEEKVYVRQIFGTDPEKLKKEILYYFSQREVVFTLAQGREQNGASIMARILRLDLLMDEIKGEKETSFVLTVRDDFCRWQNGTFRFMIGKDGSKIERTRQEAAQTITIRDLTKLIFGFEEEALREEYPQFQFLKSLAPVMIGEII